MTRRSFRGNKSGQVLVVSALLVALLLFSTAMYVIEVGKDSPIVDSNVNVDFNAYLPSIKNTLVSALANISNGGDPTVLASDLDSLQTIICVHSYQALLSMDYSLPNSGTYSNGVWLSWGSNGVGISGVYASFAFNASSTSGDSTAAYSVNVTSALQVSGSYTLLNQSQSQLNLSIAVADETGPALAQNFTFSLQNGTDWLTAGSPVLIDHGDGSYAASFTVDSALSDPVVASVACSDVRGIYVMANVTCNRIT